MTTQPKVALFVPLTAKSSQSQATQEFLLKGYSIVEQTEPLTLQWFALKETSTTSTDSGKFVIFDTAANEEGRQAHLNGEVAAALLKNKDTLLVEGQEGLNINQVDILASKVKKPASGGESLTKGLSVGLKVIVKAKPAQVENVKDFLTKALSVVEAEEFTPVWYAIQFPNTNQFAIVDFFENEEGRQQHLSGNVAKALFAAVDELLEGQPEVAKVDVLAAKL
ncbi:hypothetical protein K474DRAFT_1664925 [Panus rudis PR-1116 ss-1]|nr:hypothetical protein K474DRAFT_1664925 [Panus rudis PR-1116 ss-1]